MERFPGGFGLNVLKVGNWIKVFPVFLKNSFKDSDFLKIVGNFLKKNPHRNLFPKKRRLEDRDFSFGT
jgi:hypothetical protein